MSVDPLLVRSILPSYEKVINRETLTVGEWQTLKEIYEASISKKNISYLEVRDFYRRFKTKEALVTRLLGLEGKGYYSSTISKIVNCLLFKNELLDLSGEELYMVPICVHGFTFLRSLNVSSNHLILLSRQIGQLKHLRTFDASSNKLEFLHENMGDLKRLRRFNLSRNIVEELPDALLKLPKLKFLDCSRNKLLVMPVFEGSVEVKHAHNRYNQTRFWKKAKVILKNAKIELDLKKFEKDTTLCIFIKSWLGKLVKTHEYRENTLKCSERVALVLKLALESEEYRELLKDTVKDVAPVCDDINNLRCEDSSLLALNHLEVNRKIRQSAGEPLKNLEKLLKGTIALEMIHREAIKISQKQIDADEVEVHLALQTRLRKSLNLPIGGKEMQYFKDAFVKKKTIKKVEEKIRSKLNNAKLVHSYFVLNEMWQTALKHFFSKEYEQAIESVYEDQFKIDTETDEQYIQRMNHKKTQCQVLESQWYDEKTRELLKLP